MHRIDQAPAAHKKRHQKLIRVPLFAGHQPFNRADSIVVLVLVFIFVLVLTLAGMLGVFVIVSALATVLVTTLIIASLVFIIAFDSDEIDLLTAGVVFGRTSSARR